MVLWWNFWCNVPHFILLLVVVSHQACECLRPWTLYKHHTYVQIISVDQPKMNPTEIEKDRAMSSINTWILVGTVPMFWSKTDWACLQQKLNDLTWKTSNFKYKLAKSLCRMNPACLMDITNLHSIEKLNFVSIALTHDTKVHDDYFISNLSITNFPSFWFDRYNLV